MTRKGGAAGTLVTEDPVTSVTQGGDPPTQEALAGVLAAQVGGLLQPLISRLEGIENRLAQHDAALAQQDPPEAATSKGQR